VSSSEGWNHLLAQFLTDITMISFFSSASIIALVVATTTTTPCGCHQSFSSRDSRRSHHAFLCAKPKLTKQSLQLQHNVVTTFTVRRSKQADEGIPVLIDSESHDKERDVWLSISMHHPRWSNHERSCSTLATEHRTYIIILYCRCHNTQADNKTIISLWL